MVKHLLLLFALCACISTMADEKPEVKLSLSKNNIWQREQTFLTLEVISKDMLSRLDKEEFKQNGLSITPYNLDKVERNNKLHLILKWKIFSSLAKDQALALPRIRYRPNSGRPIKLELPELLLKVKPLPIYIPPTMPVGKIKLHSEWKNGLIIPTRKIVEWNIKVNSSQVAPQTLPAISRLLRSSESLQILPVKRFPESSKTQRYQIPVKAVSMGKLDLPKIEVRYFDPGTGRLKKATLNKPFVVVLNQWLLWLIAALLIGLLLFFVVKITPWLQQLLKKHRLKKQALQLLKQAKNYPQIRGALGKYAVAKDWGMNMTLDSFMQNYRKNNSNEKNIEILINKLQKYQFAAEKKESIDRIGRDLYVALRRS